MGTPGGWERGEEENPGRKAREEIWKGTEAAEGNDLWDGRRRAGACMFKRMCERLATGDGFPPPPQISLCPAAGLVQLSLQLIYRKNERIFFFFFFKGGGENLEMKAKNAKVSPSFSSSPFPFPSLKFSSNFIKYVVG